MDSRPATAESESTEGKREKEKGNKSSGKESTLLSKFAGLNEKMHFLRKEEESPCYFRIILLLYMPDYTQAL